MACFCVAQLNYRIKGHNLYKYTVNEELTQTIDHGNKHSSNSIKKFCFVIMKRKRTSVMQQRNSS